MNKEKRMTDKEHISSNVGCNAIGDNERQEINTYLPVPTKTTLSSLLQNKIDVNIIGECNATTVQSSSINARGITFTVRCLVIGAVGELVIFAKVEA